MSTTVGDSSGYVPNRQMSVFGYIIALVLIVILLPVLPVLVVAWVLWRLFFAEEPSESRYEPWRDQRTAASTSSEPAAADEIGDEAEEADDEGDE